MYIYITRQRFEKVFQELKSIPATLEKHYPHENCLFEICVLDCVMIQSPYSYKIKINRVCTFL